LVGVYDFFIYPDNRGFLPDCLRRFKARHELFVKGQPAKNPRECRIIYRNVPVYGDQLFGAEAGCV